MTKYNSVEEISTTVFQPMDSSDNESKSKVVKKYQNKTNLLRNLHLLNIDLMSYHQNHKILILLIFLLVTNKLQRRKNRNQKIN
ncbi:rhoGEF domain-containing protein gxcJ-like isoform X3 [Aphis craccivora]|uniref:RhoGEF domain-containing protein gxcJ-like isoform X3 n=1 Tax=Aphis craccivora TaxID=307492 RepID=A0A6G0ZAM9_APHCR|nr:rhoGEF domain-containing protein gxcJ-like isoform X3 [Aphis craccivora]